MTNHTSVVILCEIFDSFDSRTVWLETATLISQKMWARPLQNDAHIEIRYIRPQEIHNRKEPRQRRHLACRKTRAGIGHIVDHHFCFQ